MRKLLLTTLIRFEQDVVFTKQRARQLASLLGFDSQDQTRISTAVSELARNAFCYAGGGKVEFLLEGETTLTLFVISFVDQGPGIPEQQLQEILHGFYHSKTGMGLGILGAKRLMDIFSLDSWPRKGTQIKLAKYLPSKQRSWRDAEINKLVEELAKNSPQSAWQEVQQQNQELLQIMDELRRKQEELGQLNRELEDTNRGVVALYAELDEKADYLQRASEIKSRFLSNMTHEFRTPLNSILGLSRLLLEEVDGPLNSEQKKQVNFIRSSAEDLSDLVNDLLDLAKVEAGKIKVKPYEIDVHNLFASLRGMLKPLLAANMSVQLIFENPEGIPLLETDEGKVSQILRNLISNALKFTEKGEVRIRARVEAEHDQMIAFEVEDTGIGIAPEDQERIFEDFTQLDSHLQKRAKGTGLGLPLTKKLVELLGGCLKLKSAVGVGSTFTALLPMIYQGPDVASYVSECVKSIEAGLLPVLVLEDSAESIFIYDKYLKSSGYQVLAARTIKEARKILKEIKPVAIISDILLETENTWDFLSELKNQNETQDIPLIVISMVDNEKKVLSLGADSYHPKPVNRSWLVNELKKLLNPTPRETLLIIDDDKISRYLLRGFFSSSNYRILEASGGLEGLKLAQQKLPQLIILDLMMPDYNGFDVLKRLKEDEQTKDIPVIIFTSRSMDQLTEKEYSLLQQNALAILSKDMNLPRQEMLALTQSLLSKVKVKREGDEHEV